MFINDTCIGCGNCERNCPYGVIQLAPVDPERKRAEPRVVARARHGAGAGHGAAAPKSKDIPKKAVKCDMCKDLPGGAACVRAACPIRVSPAPFRDFAGTR